MKCFLFLSCIFLLISCGSNEPISTTPKFKDSSVTAILPLGQIENGQILLISRELKDFYGMKVLVLPKKSMPESCKLKNTERYDASAMLTWLKNQKPVRCDRILGVTTYDVYTQKGRYPHWGIFGLGYNPGEACIVSDNRLKQFAEKRDTFLTLVTLHEIGHNLDLPHCDKHSHCLMNDAKGTAKTLFAEKKWLCSNCRKLLKKS